MVSVREFGKKYAECPDCETTRGGTFFTFQAMFTNDPFYRCKYCGFTERLSEARQMKS